MRKFYTLMLCACSFFFTLAQQDIVVTVEDGTTNPIENAEVTIESQTLSTDANGLVTFSNMADGVYGYTVMAHCFETASGSIAVSGANINETVSLSDVTAAAVFVSTSSHPLIGSWVDGDITISNADNSYTYSVTEFDNVVSDIAFGTYDYSFVRSGGCYPEVTGSITVDCDAIDPVSSNIFLGIVADQPETTSAAVFVSTSSHPLIGSWVDGDITISNADNSYTYSVTEFDNVVADIAFGTYDYSFIRSGGCYPEVTGSLTVDCDAIDPISSNIFLSIVADQSETTSAAVFVSTSSHPLIGSWVDGDITISNSDNSYTYSVTEFDNVVADIAFGTYDYSFMRSGGCYPEVTGSLTVDCDAIDPISSNIFLGIVADQSETTSAAVFVSTSSHPLIGSWVDGDIIISNADNNYSYSVTEFDNVVADIAFGTYDYSFVRSGGCYPEVTGSLTVDCDAIDSISGNIFLGIVADQPETTSAAVFVSTSSHPLIGSWVDGDISISNADNSYTYSVTEFDNVVADIAFGTYDYSFVRSGECYPEVTGSITVDCDAIDSISSNIFLGIVADQPETTSAAVFVSTSSHPLIGSWVDGDITISNADNSYTYSVTEFDNVVADIAFGTYDYSFMRSGGCYPEVTGSLTVDCDAIDSISGNVFLGIVADQPETTSAAVFVSTSSHPLIGSWVDGDISLSNADNSYSYSVTEFDNVVADIAFGTYDYSFMRSGGCYPEVTGSLSVDCDAIDPISGNIFLGIVADQPETTSAAVFVSTSSHPLIGSWVDGDITISNADNSYTYSVTEFDNVVADIAFGTYDYSFMRSGGCYPEVTGSITIDCDAIDPISSNIFLEIVADQPEIVLDTSVAQNDHVLSANAEGDDISYQWIDCDNGNQDIEGANAQEFTAETNGSYAVRITDNRCEISETSECIVVASLSVDETSDEMSLRAYPNPFTNSIELGLNKRYEEVWVTIYSIDGKTMGSYQFRHGSNLKIEVSNLSSGTYILNVMADGRGFSEVLIKQ